MVAYADGENHRATSCSVVGLFRVILNERKEARSLTVDYRCTCLSRPVPHPCHRQQ